MSLKQYSEEQLKEMALVEIAYEIFSEHKKPITFQELTDQVASLLGMGKEELEDRIAQFYTDLNIDGSFLTTGSNLWGLKRWYPVEQIEEEITNAPKKKKKKKTTAKKEKAFDDTEDLDLDEEELDFDDTDLDDELDDFDDFDEEEIDDVDDDTDDFDEDDNDTDDNEVDDEDEDENLQDLTFWVGISKI